MISGTKSVTGAVAGVWAVLWLAGLARAAGPATQPGGNVIRNISYQASDSLTDDERQRCKLDLYLPTKTKTPFATVVWFHGGGLEAGKRSDAVNVHLARALAEQGVACVNVGYRLSPESKYPAYLDDAAASTAWTLAHISEYGGDPHRVFVSGHSAGAYLAAAVGYIPKFLAKYEVSPNQLAGVLPVSPQVFTHFTIRKERGVPNPQTTPVIDDDAPAYHARADAPATLILIGDDDWPTRLEECTYFIKLLHVLKHPDARLQVIAHRTHGSIADKASQPGDPTLVAMLDFIAKHQAGAAPEEHSEK